MFNYVKLKIIVSKMFKMFKIFHYYMLLIYPAECGDAACVGLSSGTATPAEKCTCRCLHHLPVFRDDLQICVDDIHGKLIRHNSSFFNIIKCKEKIMFLQQIKSNYKHRILKKSMLANITFSFLFLCCLQFLSLTDYLPL